MARPRLIARRTSSPARLVALTAALLLLAFAAGWGAPTAALGAAPRSVTPKQVQYREWWLGALGLQVNARDAGGTWAVTKGKGVTVAVLDTGVDATVPDLSGALVPGFSADGSGSPTVDHDTSSSGGHGTAMAVAIAGRGTGPGVLGVAPQAKIMPVYIPGDAQDNTPAALDKLSASASPPAVVNMSFGEPGSCPPALQASVARAVARGMILVASAGNTGDVNNYSQYPSNCKGVVAVGAFDPEGKPWTSTQRQPYVAIGGPGTDIESYGKDRVPGLFHGTSYAAAIVSGEYALLRAHWPTMPSRQLVAKLFHATSPAYSGPGYGQSGNVLGFGVGVVDRALKQNVPADASNPVYDALAKVSPGVTTPSSAPSSAPGSSSTPSAGRSTVGVDFPGSGDSAGSSSDGGSNTGLIIGVVVAVVAVLAIAAGVLLARRRSAGHRSPG